MEDMKENEEVNEEIADTSEGEEVVETSENTKTYTEEEVEAIRNKINEDNQKAWNKRWGQEKSKLERAHEKESEFINLLKSQTGAEDINQLLDNAYEQYGVDKPIKSNKKDEEVLGKNDAKEILELDDDYIEEEANRLASKKRSAREEATFMELGRYLTDKKEKNKRLKEIKENGIDESVLDDESFKDFAKDFNKDTSIKKIYDLYNQINPKKKPFSAGSLKGGVQKEENEFFTREEFEALTDKDLDNDKVYEKAMKSMRHFYNS